MSWNFYMHTLFYTKPQIYPYINHSTSVIKTYPRFYYWQLTNNIFWHDNMNLYINKIITILTTKKYSVELTWKYWFGSGSNEKLDVRIGSCSLEFEYVRFEFGSTSKILVRNITNLDTSDWILNKTERMYCVQFILLIGHCDIIL